MRQDDLSDVFDDASPDCPSCGERLEDAGEDYRPHLYCPHCRISVMVPGRP